MFIKRRFAKNRTRKARAVFVDRDGVINKDPAGWTKHSYVTSVREFVFLDGVFEALRKLKLYGYKVYVISNQAGVSKGYFTKGKLDQVNSYMMGEVEKNGGKIEEAFYCVHKKEDSCDCRKPKTGLFDMVSEKYGVNPKGAYFIGDSEVDVLAGRDVGARTVFVLSGKTSAEEMNKWQRKPDFVFKNLLGVVNWMIEKDRRRSQRAFRKEKEGRERDVDE